MRCLGGVPRGERLTQQGVLNMQGFQQITIVGRVGKNPQITPTDKGKVAKFPLAVNEKYKDTERTEWFDVAVFNGLAGVVEQYVRQGTPLHIAGRIRSSKYTDKDGIERWSSSVIVDDLLLLPDGNKPEAEGE
jgi:single-strand DNA-binding protein